MAWIWYKDVTEILGAGWTILQRLTSSTAGTGDQPGYLRFYANPGPITSTGFGEIKVVLTRAEQREREFSLLRYNLRFRCPRRALPRPQRPVGFSDCAPLARSRC